jgi:hypothetical protein
VVKQYLEEKTLNELPKICRTIKSSTLRYTSFSSVRVTGCDIARPQTIEDILEDTEKFISTQYKGMEDFKVWEPFTEFYQATGWIKFVWIYLGQIPKPFKNRFSGSDIYSILEIYDPEAIYSAEENRMVDIPENERLNQPYKLYDEYRMFDRIFLDSYRHVAVKFFRTKKRLFFTIIFSKPSLTTKCQLVLGNTWSFSYKLGAILLAGIFC